MQTCIECYGEFKQGLTYDEIKELFKEFFGKNWSNVFRSFNKWMRGQTLTVSKIGQVHLVYRWDVKRFVEAKLEGKPTYWD